jgi:hypothetical protein
MIGNLIMEVLWRRLPTFLQGVTKGFPWLKQKPFFLLTLLGWS